MPVYSRNSAVYNLNARLTDQLKQQEKLLQKRERLINAPVVKIAQLEKVNKELAKSDKAITSLASKGSRLAGTALADSLTRAAGAALVAGGAVTALLTKTAALYDPAASLIFEYRLRDLGAVTGSVLKPSFDKLSDSVKGFSKWLYNLPEGTKSFLNLGVGLVAVLGGISLGIGGIVAAFRPLVTVGVSVWGALTAAVLKYNAAAAMSGSPAITRGGVLKAGGKMLLGGGIGGTIGHSVGLTGGGIGAGIGVYGFSAGPLIGTITTAIGFLAGTIIEALANKAFGGGGDRDPSGLAPREVTTLSSGLQAGRMFREASASKAAFEGGAPDVGTDALNRNTSALMELTHAMGSGEGNFLDNIRYLLGLGDEASHDRRIKIQGDIATDFARRREREERPVAGGK